VPASVSLLGCLNIGTCAHDLNKLHYSDSHRQWGSLDTFMKAEHIALSSAIVKLLVRLLTWVGLLSKFGVGGMAGMPMGGRS
jgi:hypothetical protein